MRHITLYVKDSDKPTWNRARRLAKGNLSAFVSEALAAHVQRKEQSAREQRRTKAEMARTILEVGSEEDFHCVSFTGRLLAEWPEPSWKAYVTRAGRLVVLDSA